MEVLYPINRRKVLFTLRIKSDIPVPHHFPNFGPIGIHQPEGRYVGAAIFEFLQVDAVQILEIKQELQLGLGSERLRTSLNWRYYQLRALLDGNMFDNGSGAAASLSLTVSLIAAVFR